MTATFPCWKGVHNLKASANNGMHPTPATVTLMIVE
jgi:hypothetical protein